MNCGNLLLPTSGRRSCAPKMEKSKWLGRRRIDRDMELSTRSVERGGEQEDEGYSFQSLCHSTDGGRGEIVYELSSSYTASASNDVKSCSKEKEGGDEDDDEYDDDEGYNSWMCPSYPNRRERYRNGGDPMRPEKATNNNFARRFFRSSTDHHRERTASSSSTGCSPFKFPTLNMGVCLFGKKRRGLRRNGTGENSSTIKMVNLNSSSHDQSSDGSRPISNNSALCSIEMEPTPIAVTSNAPLFRRIHNRLCGRKMTSRVSSVEVTEKDARGSCSYRRYSGEKCEQITVQKAYAGDDAASSTSPALCSSSTPFESAGVRDNTADREQHPIGASSSGGISCLENARSPTATSTMADIYNEMSWESTVMHTGPKYKLVNEGQIQVCRVNHPRNLLGKLSSSKFLRRWEVHTIVLDTYGIRSKTSFGFFDQSIKYVQIEDVQVLPQWDSSGERFCLRIFVPEGSLLLQTNRQYALNQWFYSIQWKRSVFRCQCLIETNCDRPEVLLKELNCLVKQSLFAPLQGDELSSTPVKLVRNVLNQITDGSRPREMLEPVLTCVAPLLDRITTIAEVSPWLCKHCRECPRSRIIEEVLADVALLTLKKNMDFGKYVSTRVFVQEFLFALCVQNDGCERVKAFVRSAHGENSVCPHPRVLPNLVTVCLGAVHALHDEQNTITSTALRSHPVHVDSHSPSTSYQDCDLGANGALPLSDVISEDGASKRMASIASVLETMSEFEDWRLPLASMLQPVQFPEELLQHDSFTIPFTQLIRRVGTDKRCEVHLAVLGVREGKEGWFHLTCPGGPACVDDGHLFSSLLRTLLHCCCRRKKFLQSLNGMLGPLQLLALRECEPAIEALCDMLELDVVEGKDWKLQVITTLLSTPAGKHSYTTLCDRQMALRELQQKGGPRKLTLPSKSTDADLAVLLSSGSFGNLEWLSLAFTNVTSTCAEYLIKLPSLRYLNLWSTQFGDVGVQVISEHLHKLQVLNLCETPVTDKGLRSLSALTSLKKLNLNSTQLSASTFRLLRAKLPALQEIDVRYTDAWCADEFISWP